MIYASVDELVELFFTPNPESEVSRELLAGKMSEEELIETVEQWMIFLSTGPKDTADRIIPTPPELTAAILARYREMHVREKSGKAPHGLHKTE